MKCIIAGPRTITESAVLIDAIASSGWAGEITEVVSGGADGIDTMGERYADVSGLPMKRFPADWEKHGKAAGPIRNRQMAEYADALLAIRHGDSPGTADMIRQATANGLRVFVYEVAAARTEDGQ